MKIIRYSGGKDSTALLHVMRNELDQYTVIFGDTGASFPHIRDFVRETCDSLGARLVIVRQDEDIFAFHESHGLPSDIVPVEMTVEMAPFISEKPKQLVQSYVNCCSKMLWGPMQKFIRENGVTHVLTGSKKSDSRVGVGRHYVEDGIEYDSPLWEWTDEDVRTFLRERNVKLPEHYASVNDSLDCWACTAHLAHHGEAKMRYVKEHHPELWPALSERTSRLKAALVESVSAINGALNV